MLNRYSCNLESLKEKFKNCPSIFKEMEKVNAMKKEEILKEADD